MMIEFYQTAMGRMFYERTMPKIANALADIAKEMHMGNQPVVIEGTQGINFEALVRDLKGFEIEDVYRLALIDMCKIICELPMDQILNECKARHDSAFSIEELVDIQDIFHGIKEALDKYLSSVKSNDMEGYHG